MAAALDTAAAAADMAGPRPTADNLAAQATPEASQLARPLARRQALTPSAYGAVSARPCIDLSLRRLWNWFSSVDSDRSGQISAHELRECR